MTWKRRRGHCVVRRRETPDLHYGALAAGVENLGGATESEDHLRLSNRNDHTETGTISAWAVHGLFKDHSPWGRASQRQRRAESNTLGIKAQILCSEGKYCIVGGLGVAVTGVRGIESSETEPGVIFRRHTLSPLIPAWPEKDRPGGYPNTKGCHQTGGEHKFSVVIACICSYSSTEGEANVSAREKKQRGTRLQQRLAG